MKTIICTFLILISSATLFSQEKVYMPFFEVLNMHPDYQYSSSKLFRTYLVEQNKYDLLLPEKCDSLYKEKPDQTVEAAKRLNAPYYGLGEINVVGNNLMVISFSMYKTSDGSKVWSDLIKAKGLADLDPVLNKLAQALSANTKVNVEGDIYNVSNYESKQLQKVNTNYYWGLLVGGAYPFLKYVDKPSAGLGAIFSYDSRNWIIDVKGELYFGDAGFYNFNISMTYPFSQKNHSLFANGGLGFGGLSYKELNVFYNNYETKTSGGMLFFAGGGYLLNRSSDVNVRIGAQMFVSGFKAQGVIPVGALLSITVLFEK